MTGIMMHHMVTGRTVTASTGTGTILTGLVLHLDAGNPASYSGTGTTWTNLARASMNGTLGAGNGYSSANGGSISFAGGASSIVAVASATSATSLTNNISIEVWYKGNNLKPKLLATGVGSNGVCFGQFDTNATKWKVTKYGVVDIYAGSVPQNTGTWHQAVVTYSSSAGTKVYVDGSLSETNVSIANIAASNVPTINIGTLESTYHNGNISIVRWYNTVLSAAGVLQNFNATRGRYGI